MNSILFPISFLGKKQYNPIGHVLEVSPFAQNCWASPLLHFLLLQKLICDAASSLSIKMLPAMRTELGKTKTTPHFSLSNCLVHRDRIGCKTKQTIYVGLLNGTSVNICQIGGFSVTKNHQMGVS